MFKIISYVFVLFLMMYLDHEENKGETSYNSRMLWWKSGRYLELCITGVIIFTIGKKDHALPSVFYMESLLYKYLCDQDQKGQSQTIQDRTTYNISIITRKDRKLGTHFDIFSFDIILVPVNIEENHWCLVSIDNNKGIIKLYDPLIQGGGYHKRVANEKVLKDISILTYNNL